MITTLDTQSWSVEDLTGNAQVVYGNAAGSPPETPLYLASNVRADNTWILLKSLDFGYHWSPAGNDASPPSPAVFTFPVPNKQFDPAVALDPATGLLYIIGTQPNAVPTDFDLVLYVWDTNTDMLSSGPTTLTTSSRVPSDYDIINMGSGVMGVAVSLVNGFLAGSPPTAFTGNNLLYLVLSGGNITLDKIIDSSPFRTGNSFGAVTMFSPDGGTTIELYYNSHPKPVLFADISVNILSATRIGTWATYGSPPTDSVLLNQFTCRYVDEKLTVVGYGTERMISTCYFNFLAHFGQHTSVLSGNILLGNYNGTSWSFNSVLAASPNLSLVEPTLSVFYGGSPPGPDFILAYLVRDLTNPNVLTGTFQLATVTTTPKLSLVPIATPFSSLNFTWLRGTVDVVDSNSMWLVVAEREVSVSPLVDTPVFMSGFQVPPIAILEPSVLTLDRNVLFTFSAAGSSDPNLNPVSYNWSLVGLGSPPADVSQILLQPNGATATVLVENSVGPAAFQFEVIVTVTDTVSSLSDSADSVVTVPYNPPPTISFSAPLVFSGSPPQWNMDAERNALVIVTPVITLGRPSDQATYLWQQISGTPVTIESNPASPQLVFTTNGADVLGDSLVFSLTVNDQINPAVTETITVNVAEYIFNPADTSILGRALWAGTISQRNDDGSTELPSQFPRWSALYLSAEVCNLIGVKRATIQSGDDRYILISPYSILVKGDSLTAPTMGTVLLRRLFPPTLPISPPTHTFWVDAFHTETDYTIALGEDMNLYQYTTAPLINSDNPQAIIDLSALTTLTFESLFSTVTYNNRRILVLSGDQGLIIVQINNITFAVESFMEITLESGLLYGADNVLWVRVDDVESIGSGRVLVGTLDAQGNTFETLINLNQRTIEGTWDASKLINRTVATGEFIASAPDFYDGILQAPVMLTPGVNSRNNITLSWTQQRYDLAQSYTLQFSLDDGQSWSFLAFVGSGSIFTYNFQGTPGNNYSFQMFSTNADGSSSFSNVSQCWVGPLATPFFSAPISATPVGSPLVGYAFTLDWSANDPNTEEIGSYQLQMQVDNGPFLTIASLEGGENTTFTTATQPIGHTYSFQVSAFVLAQGQDTAYSPIVSVTI